jgi:hypothetical protein
MSFDTCRSRAMLRFLLTIARFICQNRMKSNAAVKHTRSELSKNKSSQIWFSRIESNQVNSKANIRKKTSRCQRGAHRLTFKMLPI